MWPFKKKKNKMRFEYFADGFGVLSKTRGFMTSDAFEQAWEFAAKHSESGWAGTGGVPDIRWRVHIAIWAANHGLSLEGDFVECGVFTGILSLSICKYLQFDRVEKNFWLYDGWGCIPIDSVEPSERSAVENLNKVLYSRDNVYESVVKAFSPYPNCNLVRGMLPETLERSPDKIAYLSVDLNNAPAEKACIELLWPRLSNGAIVVIDDYAWVGHELQRDMWDKFAASHNQLVATLPTGQGILIKSS